MSEHRVKSPSLLTYAVILLLAFSCLTLGSCGGNISAQTDPQADYEEAVRDAMTVTPAKVSKNLTPLVPGNTSLRWENGIPGSRVLVATWIANQPACEDYSNALTAGCKAGRECPNYGYTSWVTTVPELRNLLGSAPTLLRVAQALGLPPPAAGQTLDNTCVIELYVSPANLFRPSPDPEVTDEEAEVSFPMDGFRRFDDTALVYSEMPCDGPRCPNCTPSGKCGMTSYRNWFENRRAYVYSQTAVSGPYPWTALGYTYDWGNRTPPHFGVSEFVINAGSGGIPVFIRSVSWTRAYFNN